MGNQLKCSDCHLQNPQPYKDRISSYTTLQQITDGLNQFYQDKKLIFYPTSECQMIERLFSIRQKHICQLIVKLHQQNNREAKQNLINDVSKLNLQKIDQLFWKNLYHLDLRATQRLQGSLYQQNNAENKICENKYEDKNKQILEKYGDQILRKGQIIVLACVQCFNGIGCLTSHCLPSKKSPLEILLDKIQALDDKYDPISVPIIILTSPQYLQQVTELCTNNYPNIKSHIIKYESIYPSFDLEGKFTITSNNRLYFPTTNGDIIGFINSNYQIGQLVQRYQYLHWVDPCNYLDKICDNFLLGSLKYYKIDAVGKIINSNKNTSLVIKEGFIEQYPNHQSSFIIDNKQRTRLNHVLSKNGEKTRNLTLIPSIILSTHMIINMKPKRQQLFLTKVKIGRINNQHQPSLKTKKQQFYCFQRSILNILNQKFIKLYYVDRLLEYARCSTQTQLHFQQKKSQISLVTEQFKSVQLQLLEELPGEILYSNYCKKFLRIKNENLFQLVQVCPQILFGSKQKQKRIKQALMNCKKIGFPLIVKKNIQHFQQENN